MKNKRKEKLLQELKNKTKIVLAATALSSILVGCSEEDIDFLKNEIKTEKSILTNEDEIITESLDENQKSKTEDSNNNEEQNIEKSNNSETIIIVNSIPDSYNIPTQYSNVENYYKFKVINEEAIKYYNSKNIYILYDKETYAISEFIYADKEVYDLGFPTTGIELYDLSTEEMLVYDNGLGTFYNLEYYDSIRENNYQVCLADVEDYIEGEIVKEYYSLEEIRALEPQIAEGLKIINGTSRKLSR